MLGTILYVDDGTKAAVVRAEDGKRYTFALADLPPGITMRAGDQVSFAVDGGRAVSPQPVVAGAAVASELTAPPVPAAVAGSTRSAPDVTPDVTRSVTPDVTADQGRDALPGSAPESGSASVEPALARGFAADALPGFGALANDDGGGAFASVAPADQAPAYPAPTPAYPEPTPAGAAVPRPLVQPGAAIPPGAPIMAGQGEQAGASGQPAAPVYDTRTGRVLTGGPPVAATGQSRLLWLIVGGVVLALLAALGWMMRDNALGSGSASDAVVADAGQTITRYALRDVDVRSAASNAGQILGRVTRGEAVTGVTVAGTADADTRWIQLASGTRYVALIGLSEAPPPPLTGAFNVPMTAADTLVVRVQPTDGAAVLRSIETGARFQLLGRTTQGWAEIALPDGAIGYAQLADSQWTGIGVEVGAGPAAGMPVPVGTDAGKFGDGGPPVVGDPVDPYIDPVDEPFRTDPPVAAPAPRPAPRAVPRPVPPTRNPGARDPSRRDPRDTPAADTSGGSTSGGSTSGGNTSGGGGNGSGRDPRDTPPVGGR